MGVTYKINEGKIFVNFFSELSKIHLSQKGMDIIPGRLMKRKFKTKKA